MELHNSLVSDRNDDSIKDSRDEENNISISDYTLCSLLPTQLKQMSAQYKVMCGYECFISAKTLHSSLLSCRDQYLKEAKDQIQNDQSRRSGEK